VGDLLGGLRHLVDPAVEFLLVVHGTGMPDGTGVHCGQGEGHSVWTEVLRVVAGAFGSQFAIDDPYPDGCPHVRFVPDIRAGAATGLRDVLYSSRVEQFPRGLEYCGSDRVPQGS
jgi:hypothetical protein